jgi:hypothetical protein
MDGVGCLEDEEGLLLHVGAVIRKVDDAPCQAILKVLVAGCVLPVDSAAAAAAAGKVAVNAREQQQHTND